MRKFKDKTGRDWELSFDLTTTKRVKDNANLDLLDIGENGAFLTLGTNPYRAAEVLFWLVEPQTKERNISVDQFMQALDGDTIEKAIELLWEDAIDFFPQARRPMIRAAIGQLKAGQKIAAEAATEVLENNPRIEKALRAKCRAMVDELNRRLDLEADSLVTTSDG